MRPEPSRRSCWQFPQPDAESCDITDTDIQQRQSHLKELRPECANMRKCSAILAADCRKPYNDHANLQERQCKLRGAHPWWRAQNREPGWARFLHGVPAFVTAAHRPGPAGLTAAALVGFAAAAFFALPLAGGGVGSAGCVRFLEAGGFAFGVGVGSGVGAAGAGRALARRARVGAAGWLGSTAATDGAGG